MNVKQVGASQANYTGSNDDWIVPITFLPLRERFIGIICLREHMVAKNLA